MRKTIAITTALLLAGFLVNSASAAVSMNGDARTRWTYHQYSDGTDATENDEKWSSRIRVNLKATAKGGAYAKARLRMADAKWDGTRQTRNKGAGSNLYTDYAYIGVPIGQVTVEAGLQKVDLTRFTIWDEREDMLSINWTNDNTALDFWYIKDAEYTNTATDTIDDEDVNKMALILEQKWGGHFRVKASGFYTDDQTPADKSGFTGFLSVGGSAGQVTLDAELAYNEADVQGTTDDGLGGYVQGMMKFGDASLTLNGGFTKDGYVADDDFGFLMIGGDTAITADITRNIGAIGDTLWGGTILGFKVSENLNVKALLAYIDVDNYGSLFEVSGGVTYIVSDGATIEWLAGYVAIDDDSDTAEAPFATGLTFNVNF